MRLRALSSGTIRKAAIAVAAVGLLAVGAWAGRSTILADEPELVEAPSLTYTAEAGTLEQSFLFSVEARWDLTSAASNQLNGVVTSTLAEPGVRTLVEEGTELFSVALQPVVVAQGEVPASRELAVGMRGPDVAQLQRFLQRAGFGAGADDGVFDESLAAALRRWQRSHQQSETGSLPLGSVIFVASLPATMVLPDDIRVGASVVAGAPAALAMPPDPDLVLRLSADQARLVPTDSEIIVSLDGERRSTAVASVRELDDGGIGYVLASSEPHCPRGCPELPVLTATMIDAEVVVLPSTTGTVLPAAAVATDPDGSTYVTTAAGDRLPVDVLAALGGEVVVANLEPGTQVRLP